MDMCKAICVWCLDELKRGVPENGICGHEELRKKYDESYRPETPGKDAKPDILDQMFVRTPNGDSVLFMNITSRASTAEMRDTLETARLDNLMKLGIATHKSGPLRVVDVFVKRDDDQ